VLSVRIRPGLPKLREWKYKSGKVEKMKKNSSKSKEEKRGGLKAFSEETKVELKRVTWPDRKTAAAASLVILFIVTTVTLYTSAVDIVLSKAFELLKSMG
jgi:preprotein translocase subunit SecE